MSAKPIFLRYTINHLCVVSSYLYENDVKLSNIVLPHNKLDINVNKFLGR